MKTIFGIFRTPGLAFLVILSTLFISCDKDNLDDTNNDQGMYATRGDASGSQQNPPVTTSASGTILGLYNVNNNKWEYEINWTGLSSAATAVQISGPASAGVNGQLQLTLAITTNGISGAAMGSVTLTEEQEAHLLAEKLYYTVHSATHLSGEIRGQIVVVRATR